MIKIATIIGARPQFIKAATVSRAIAEKNKTLGDTEKIKEIIIHTGQHYDENMSKIFFDELEIPKPDYNLDVGSGSHGSQTGAMMAKIEAVLLKQKPDIVLTYGDTNSTMAGAVTAVKLHIPSAHVEAGLRSYNRHMPEEINRVIADEISHFLFCPTPAAISNLHKEGISGEFKERFTFNSQAVFKVGDVMFDSVLFNRKLAEKKSDILNRLEIANGGYILGTIHRAENTDDPERLNAIITALNDISSDGMSIILPLHPRTKKYIHQLQDKNSGSGFHSNIKIIDPVGYLDMLQLEENARMILTDSGGVQKEAYFLETPCITLRDETEWVETVEAGWNIIVSANPGKINEAYAAAKTAAPHSPPFLKFLSSEAAPPSVEGELYGDGHAAEKILDVLEQFLSCNKIGTP